MAQVIRFIVSISLVLTFSSVALSQVPVPSPGQADAPVGRGGNYILAPNDIVLVKVFQEPDLDSQHRISQNGTINFPLIGLVKVGGKTVEGAADTIKGMLAPRYLKHPEVRVNVLEYRAAAIHCPRTGTKTRELLHSRGAIRQSHGSNRHGWRVHSFG